MTNESERAAFEKSISRIKALSNVYMRDGTGATDALYNLAVKHGASEQEAAGFAHHANHGLNDLQSLVYDMAAVAQARAQLIAEQAKAEPVVPACERCGECRRGNFYACKNRKYFTPKAEPVFRDSDLILVPRSVLGAALGALRHRDHPAANTIELLRQYSMRDSAPQPSPVVAPQGGVELFVKCSRCHGSGQQTNGTTGNGPDDTTWQEDCEICGCAGYVPASKTYLDQLSASGWFELHSAQSNDRVAAQGGDEVRVVKCWVCNTEFPV